MQTTVLNETVLDFWKLNLHTHLRQDFEVVFYTSNRLKETLPQISASKLADQVLRLDVSKVYLADSDSQILGEVFRKSAILKTSKTLQVFAKEGELSELSDSEFVRSIHSLIKSEVAWLKNTTTSAIKLIEPHIGSLGHSSNTSSLLIGVPVFKRLTLLNLFAEYMFKFLVPSLKWKGFNTTVVFCGEDAELNALHKFKHYPEFSFIHHSNNLGEKKNLILSLFTASEYDYLMWIDSDDFFHPDVCEALVKKASNNEYWASIEPFSFYNTINSEFLFFEGYGSNQSLHGWGMGSGRVFTKACVQRLDIRFAKGNRSMDESVKDVLSTLSLPKGAHLLTSLDVDYLPIGVKTKQNIWEFSKYSGTSLHPRDLFVAWLPYEIRNSLDTLEFDAE